MQGQIGGIVGRESLITAGTLGLGQLARGGSMAAFYGYRGATTIAAGRDAYSITEGSVRAYNGDNWGYLEAGLGGVGFAGNLTAFTGIKFPSILHKNSNAYVGPQAVYVIQVNGTVLKYGKADMSSLASSGLPVRLQSQLNKLQQLNPNDLIRGKILYQNPSISTQAIKQVETNYIQQYYDTYGVLPPRNLGHPGIRY